jgi:hypothetical protein
MFQIVSRSGISWASGAGDDGRVKGRITVDAACQGGVGLRFPPQSKVFNSGEIGLCVLALGLVCSGQ